MGKNLAVNLCDLRQHAEAALILGEMLSLGAALGRSSSWCSVWRARWPPALGRTEEALCALARVRRKFTALGIAYEAALVTPELAKSLLALGRTGKVRSARP